MPRLTAFASRSAQRLTQVALLAATLLATACGSPFVEGWREEKVDMRTDAEKCDAREGWSWTDEGCAEDKATDTSTLSETECQRRDGAIWIDGQCRNFAGLTEPQCSAVGGAEWTWYDDGHGGECMPAATAACKRQGPNFDLVEDRCETLPTLKAKGSLTQTVASGQAMTPVDLTPSVGASVEVVDQTCPGFFAVSGNTVGSVGGATPPEGKKTCEANLVVSVGKLKSLPVHITVEFTSGFLELCRSQPTDAIGHTVAVLVQDVAKKNDCAEASVALAAAIEINLTDGNLVDLSPLTGLPNLKTLILENNRNLIDIDAIAGLSNLVSLDLSNTKVDNLTTLAASKSLQFLQMDGTPLADGTVEKTSENCPTNKGANPRVRTFCKDP